MADKLTPKDLQQMKANGKKIAAAVVYDATMTEICEKAGVDLLSVGDSLGRTYLGQDEPDDYLVEEMMVFARAVARTAKRAVVSVDMPTLTCKHGAKEVFAAAKRLKEEAHVDLTKVDIRTQEEELFEDVQAVLEAGLGVYPQIGFATFGGQAGIRSDPASRDHVLKWAKKVEEAGASLIDMTNVTPEIYAEVVKSVRIPVIGGQTGPEADGRIYVMGSVTGYRAQDFDQANAPLTAAKLAYDIAQRGFANIHAGKWKSGSATDIAPS